MAHHATKPIWGEKSPDEKISALRQMIDDLYGFVLRDTNQRLLAMLDAAIPADDLEAEAIQRMRPLIEAHSNIIAQNCEVGHITGSALIVDLTQGRVLLHLHKKLNVWLPMGGHVDDETDISQVALREASEESGLTDLVFFPDASELAPFDFDMHTIPESADRPEHYHLDFRYLLGTYSPETVVMDPDESLAIRWLTFDEALASSDLMPDVKRMVRKARAAYERHK